MTQKARPASDVSNSGWTPQTVFSKINEVVPDDTTLVSSSTNPQGDSFEVKLPPMAWPQGGQGTLRVRLNKTGPDDIPVILSLKQGSIVLAYATVHPGTSFAEFDLVLPQSVLAQITDYTDLRLHVTAGYGVQVSCCPGLLPDVLTATVTNKTGGAVCLPDSFVLMWRAGLWMSVAQVGACRGAISLSCQTGGGSCASFGLQPGLGGITLPDPGCSCSPLNLVFSNVSLSGPFCGGSAGTATFTITE
jgi:hypothetical protein